MKLLQSEKTNLEEDRQKNLLKMNDQEMEIDRLSQELAQAKSKCQTAQKKSKELQIQCEDQSNLLQTLEQRYEQECVKHAHALEQLSTKLSELQNSAKGRQQIFDSTMKQFKEYFASKQSDKKEVDLAWKLSKTDATLK